MTAQPTGRTREAADGRTEHEYRGESGTCFWAVPWSSHKPRLDTAAYAVDGSSLLAALRAPHNASD
jgi:hypothetical protein